MAEPYSQPTELNKPQIIGGIDNIRQKKAKAKVPEYTTFQTKLGLIDEPIKLSEMSNNHSQIINEQLTPLNARNQLLNRHLPSPLHKGDNSDIFKDVFGPEVLAASNERHRTSQGI